MRKDQTVEIVDDSDKCNNPPEGCMLLSRRLEDRDHAVRELQRDMLALQTALAESSKQTTEIIEIYKGMKILVLMLKSVGFVARWVITISAAFGIMVALWKYGVVSAVFDMDPKIGK